VTGGPPSLGYGAAVFAFAALQAKTGAGGETRTHTTFLACSFVKITQKANVYNTLDTNKRYALSLCRYVKHP
jgi:hypothetical protein